MVFLIILFAVLMFSLLIFVHEFGHFIAAKLSGVRVNEFSIFMGPAIVKWQRGETLYAIRTIPIGGYCAMEGEDTDTDDPRSFQKAKWWKRLIILVAGSAMNFIAGVLIIFMILMPAVRFTTTGVDDIMVGSSFSEGNAILPGDTLLEIDGEKLYIQPDFSLILEVKPAKHHDVLVLRGGEKVMLEDVIFEVRQLTEKDGTPFTGYGIVFDSVEATLGQKLKYTWNYALDYVRMVRLSLAMLIRGDAGVEDMSGPVGIVDQMSQAAQSAGTLDGALYTVMNFAALIAINLGVMNLLPIPALDGGRAVCLLITTAVEGITKKKLNPKYEGYLHAAGMILLLGFMAFITLKDILGLFR